MSLAMYASDFNKEGMENNPIQRKRDNLRNKTLKRREPMKSNSNVDSMMKRIHDDDVNDDDDDNGLSNYQPIQPPNSVANERIDNANANTNTNSMEQRMSEQQNVVPNMNMNNAQAQREGFTQLPSEYAKQYYQQYVPYFNQGSDDTSPNGVNKDELLTKLNQIIYLLEEQQDEKTGNVTEELILYSFLGIFIIFIVDSFARVGKYVR
jgi:hypothetical protein